MNSAERQPVKIIPWEQRLPGDIGLVCGTGPISKLIIVAEWAAGEVKDGYDWSHAFIVGNGSIFEAIFPKISLSPWDVYDHAVTRLFRIDAPEAAKQGALLELIHEYVGRGYDVTGCVLGMFGLDLLRALDSDLDNNLFADRHKEWCSELVTRYIEKIAPDPANPSSTDPQQVYNFLKGV